MAKVAKPKTAQPQKGVLRQFCIPSELVEHILLGPTEDRRVLQDSPLLGDVWEAYAADPGNIRDVLITPYRTVTAAMVASILPEALQKRDMERTQETRPTPPPREPERAKIAYLQGVVAVRMYFDQVLRILVPLTQWWYEQKLKDRIAMLGEPDNIERLRKLLKREIGQRPKGELDNFTSLERYVALAGLIYWVGKLERPEGFTRPEHKEDEAPPPLPLLPKITATEAFANYKDHIDEIIAGMFELYAIIRDNPGVLTPTDAQDDIPEDGGGYIFQVSLNRTASAALDRSVPAVKADAAQSLFKVKCDNIVWAVLDSGIDRTHPAFITQKKKTKKDTPPEYMSRIRKTFDFTRIREIVSIEPADLLDADLQKLADAAGLKLEEARVQVNLIAADAKAKRPINWTAVEQLITLKPPVLKDEIPDSKTDGARFAPFVREDDPPSPHGTHVAGIIGAQPIEGHAGGMTHDIRLYDFRVLGKTIDDTEFAIIAALQYIRHVNERHSYITIHGANLSLSIPHNVRNFACGRTPVCNECERLVESGVVVVAAAGNRGYQTFQTNDGPFENYAAFSVTDPGNGDGVITVGSTHGNWPHTYGVSFFSSRGPTGDGRLKPDLVAPGERVQSTIPGGEWGPESGTSMAAPHVSGAAAMLLARYDELVGQPRRIKRILCDSATDLGRERTFQGHGMLDVLRAFQSI